MCSLEPDPSPYLESPASNPLSHITFNLYHLQLQSLGLLTSSDLRVGRSEPSMCLMADPSFPSFRIISLQHRRNSSSSKAYYAREVRNADTIFVGKYQGKRPLERPKRRGAGDNIVT
jgi:hypothetical protein